MLDELATLEASARRALKLAGDRQMALDMPMAGGYYRQALALTPTDAPERPELIRLATSVGWRTGELDSDSAIAAYRDGIDLALAHDDKEGAAGLMRRLYFQLGLSGETGEATEVLDQAIDLLADLRRPGPCSPSCTRPGPRPRCSRATRRPRWTGPPGRSSVSRAPVVTLMALHLRGERPMRDGRRRGRRRPPRKRCALARTDGNALDIVTSYSYLNEWIAMEEGSRAALAMNAEAVALCEQRGLPHQALWSRTESLWLRFDAGEWDEILALADELEAWAKQHGEVQMEAAAASYRARVLAHRGNLEAARSEIEHLLPLARTIEDLQILAPALISAALVEVASGAHEEALARLREFDELTEGGPAEYREIHSPEVMRIAIAAGDPRRGPGSSAIGTCIRAVCNWRWRRVGPCSPRRAATWPAPERRSRTPRSVGSRSGFRSNSPTRSSGAHAASAPWVGSTTRTRPRRRPARPSPRSGSSSPDRCSQLTMIDAVAPQTDLSPLLRSHPNG